VYKLSELQRLALAETLKKQVNSYCSYDDIYNYLASKGFSRPVIHDAMDNLETQEIIELKKVPNDRGNKKGVRRDQVVIRKDLQKILDEDPKTKLSGRYEHSGFCFDSDKYTVPMRSALKDYFTDVHFNDIQFENQKIIVDLDSLYRHGDMRELVTATIEDPKTALDFFNSCYADAYYNVKTEKPPYGMHVVFTNIPESLNSIKIKNNSRLIRIEDIDSRCVGKLVEFEGDIAIASKTKVALQKAAYACTGCGEKKVIDIENPFEMNFEPICSKCAQNMMLLEDESDYVNVQEFKLYQPIDQQQNPEDPPKFQSAFWMNSDSTDSSGVFSGRVKICGIPFRRQKVKKIPVYEIYIEAIHVEKIETEIKYEITSEELKDIEKISEHPNIASILANRFFPTIQDMEEVKLGILMQLIKAGESNDRDDIHILLISDPGISKTIMMKKVAAFPGNVYGSGPSSSSVGLTAAVVREKTEFGDDTWVAKAGLFPRAHKGVLCVDEFDPDDRYLLEAMESQMIHLAKAGLNIRLPCECGALMARNPKFGRFDRNMGVLEQIKIRPEVMSRFDLIFAIMDEPEKNKDRRIAGKIISNRNASKKIRAAEKSGTPVAESGVNYDINVNGVTLTDDLLVKYILHARTLVPMHTPEAMELIEDMHQKMRKDIRGLTHRNVNTILRLSEAIAKIKLKELVNVEDVEEARDFLISTLIELAKDPESDQSDLDRIFAIPHKDRSKLLKIGSIVKKLYEEGKGDLVDFEDIFDKAREAGFEDIKEVKKILKKLIKNGDIDEPKAERYRLI